MNKVATSPDKHCISDEKLSSVLPLSPSLRSSPSASTNSLTVHNDICRICHCEADINQPLLSPCYCSGSLQYVHQHCLQQWLQASDTKVCELCKFSYIMQTKFKPINEWQGLEMSNIESRRLFCAILFHCVAFLCVFWSLFVLIDRATEEVHRGLIAWPFWTKIIVVAVGFTGGIIFMVIQCKQYVLLCFRWQAHNRVVVIQNAPQRHDNSSNHHHYQQQQRQQTIDETDDVASVSQALNDLSGRLPYRSIADSEGLTTISMTTTATATQCGAKNRPQETDRFLDVVGSTKATPFATHQMIESKYRFNENSSNRTYCALQKYSSAKLDLASVHDNHRQFTKNQFFASLPNF